MAEGSQMRSGTIRKFWFLFSSFFPLIFPFASPRGSPNCISGGWFAVSGLDNQEPEMGRTGRQSMRGVFAERGCFTCYWAP